MSAVGELEKACGCAETYLLLVPGDEDMVSNKEYYLEEEEAEGAWFVPRAEAVAYSKREAAEEKLMAFVNEEFKPEERVRNVVIRAYDDTKVCSDREKSNCFCMVAHYGCDLRWWLNLYQ